MIKNNLINQILYIIGLLLFNGALDGQSIARFEVQSGPYERENACVNVFFDELISHRDNQFELFEITDTGNIKVPFQVTRGRKPQIHWFISGKLHKNQTRVYELSATDKTSPAVHSNLVKSDTAYIFFKGELPVLTYNYTRAQLADGIDPAFSRSGYIHPLLSPSGKTLTTIQPPDHIHHYGLWNAWTRTQFLGEQIDFWNLGQKLGKVNYHETISTDSGDVLNSLKVLHLHTTFDDSTEKNIALNETLEIIVYQSPGSYHITDYISTFECAQPEGILLEEYRYGGFVFRGREEWNAITTNMLTSEGKNQSDSDGERAKWVMVNETGNKPSGILLLSHPANFNHPEPLRTWDTSANKGEANIFINFSPIRNSEWLMEYGKTYTLRYRIITFDEPLDAAMAEQIWQDYANTPKVIIKE